MRDQGLVLDTPDSRHRGWGWTQGLPSVPPRDDARFPRHEPRATDVERAGGTVEVGWISLFPSTGTRQEREEGVFEAGGGGRVGEGWGAEGSMQRMLFHDDS